MAADATGFRGEIVEKLTVEVASSQSLDFHLQLPSTTQEAVVVSASSTPVVSDSPSVQSTIVRSQIEALPLNSRDFNQLVLLAAGAVENIAGTGGDFGSAAVNGNRPYGNSYLLDGVPNNNPSQNTSASAVLVDLIREFKVTSGAADAECAGGCQHASRPFLGW